MSQSFVDPLYRDPSALAPELASLLSRMLVRGPPAGVALSKGGAKKKRAEEIKAQEVEQEIEAVDEKVNVADVVEMKDEPNNLQDVDNAGAGEDITVVGDEYGSVSLDHSVDPSDSFRSMNDSVDVELDEGNSSFFAQGGNLSLASEDGETKVGGYSDRTKMLHIFLHKQVDPKRKKAGWELGKLLEGKGRRDAAKVFYEILVLRTHRYVSTKQDTPYGSIFIAPDKNFNKV